MTNERPSQKPPGLLSIFSGIGGFDIAFAAAGFRTIGFIEFNATKRIVLEAHYPDGPFYGDIRQFDCLEFLRTVGRPHVIAGGPPCQAASLLGARLGTADERWLWPESIRLVGELRPRYCVFENPTALLSLESGRAFNGIVSEMAALGYDGWWDVIPAAAFGAGHWRERLCIVFADAQGVGKRVTSNETDAITGGGDARAIASGESHERILHPHSHRQPGPALTGSDRGVRSEGKSSFIDDHPQSSGAFPSHPDSSGRAEGRAGRSSGGGERQAEQAYEMDAADTHGQRCSEAGNSLSQGESRGSELGPQPAADNRETLSSNSDGQRFQANSKQSDAQMQGGRFDNCSASQPPRLPDLRGRVTGPNWWFDVVAGIPVIPAKMPDDVRIPVLATGLPGKLVEASSLCIGDSIVPQAFYPIAQALYEAIQAKENR